MKYIYKLLPPYIVCTRYWLSATSAQLHKMIGRLAMTAVNARKSKKRHKHKKAKSPDRSRRNYEEEETGSEASSDAVRSTTSRSSKVRKRSRQKSSRSSTPSKARTISSTPSISSANLSHSENRKDETRSRTAVRSQQWSTVQKSHLGRHAAASTKVSINATGVGTGVRVGAGMGEEEGVGEEVGARVGAGTGEASNTEAKGQHLNSNYSTDEITRDGKSEIEENHTRLTLSKNSKISSFTFSPSFTSQSRKNSSAGSLRNLRSSGRHSRPWHGDIDEEEKWYLMKLAEPRNRRADIARMREGRPAEFGDRKNDMHGGGSGGGVLTGTEDARGEGGVDGGGTMDGSSTKGKSSNHEQDLLTYVEMEQKHYKDHWGMLKNSSVVLSLDKVTSATDKVKSLLKKQEHLIEHLNYALERARLNGIVKFDRLHERLSDLDVMAVENKKLTLTILEKYKKMEKKKLAAFEEDVQLRISTSLDKARTTRDENIMNPSLEYIKRRIQETQDQHEATFRDDLVVRGTICSFVFLLRIMLIFLNFLIQPFCSCLETCGLRRAGGEADGSDDSVTNLSCDRRARRMLKSYLVTLEEFRMGGRRNNENEIQQ